MAFSLIQSQTHSQGSFRFQGVLFPHPDLYLDDIDGQTAPDFFKDLNLDQVVRAITAGFEDYNLAPFFYAPLNDLDAIAYRQEIVRDLENSRLIEAIKSFSTDMRAMREHIEHAKKLYYKYAIERAFLGAVAIYYNAVETLAHELASIDLESCRPACLPGIFDSARRFSPIQANRERRGKSDFGFLEDPLLPASQGRLGNGSTLRGGERL